MRERPVRKLILGSMLALVAATPASAERFAINCRGLESLIVAQVGVDGVGAKGMDRKATYIVDEEAQTVEEYNADKRTLSPVCGVPLVCTRDFSADRITLKGGIESGQASGAEFFDWNRKTGRLDITWDRRTSKGVVMSRVAHLRCRLTKMPKLAGA